MNKTYVVLPGGVTCREKGEMKKPYKESYYGRENSTDMDAYDLDSYNHDLKKYNQYISSLPIYTIEGEARKEGEEFEGEIIYQSYDYHLKYWEDITKGEYDEHREDGRRIVIRPIEDEGKDDMKKITKQEINSAALEAFPVKKMYGGGQPQWDDNEEQREAFIKGFEFRQWLEDATMSHPDIPLHIKFRMYKNQTNKTPSSGQ